MTDFVTPSYVTDGDVCFDDRWNQDVVDNTIALYEKLPTFFPYVQVANTTTETELYRHTIPANGLGTLGFIATELSAVCQNGSGGSAIPTIKWYLGATLVTSWGPSLATGANRTPLRATCRIQNLTASSQLSMREHAFLISPGAANSTNTLTFQGAWKDTAVDTTAELDLIVKLQWDTAHATCIFDMLCAHVIGPVYKA